MTKLCIYMLSVITSAIICTLGLISMDATVHTEARIAAGILMGLTNIGVIALICHGYFTNHGITLQDRKNRCEIARREKMAKVLYDRDVAFEQMQEALWANCTHEWPYSHTDCLCTNCRAPSELYRKDAE